MGGGMWLDRVRSDLSEYVLKGGFSDNWSEFWLPEMRVILDGDEVDLELLTESIRDVFLGASKGGRSPEQAGLQWRRFIWCVISTLAADGDELPVLGSPMSKRALPDWIRDFLRIRIGEARGLSHDPDFVLLDIRKPDGMKGELGEIEDGDFGADSLKKYLDLNPDAIRSMTVIWTKTNFNDMIQQPMLWARISMLHHHGEDPAIRHAWATVPSQRPEVFAPGTTPFNRAGTFDGGSYWGLGNRPEFGMMSIFDIIPDWEKRVQRLRGLSNESLLCKKLGFLN